MRKTPSRGTLAIIAVLAASPLAAQTMTNDKAMAGTGMASDKMMMGPKGTFAGVKSHSASGSYTINGSGKDRMLELGSDFKVDKAPDTYVILAKGMMAKDAGSVDLGKLKKQDGTQSYHIPETTDLSGYTSILLYSKKDNVVIGEATLGNSTMMDKPAMARDTGMMMKKP